MNKTVWITRTQPSAQASAKQWEAHGFNAIIAPLLKVVKALELPLKPSQDSVLVFTSKNGVFAFQSYGFTPQNTVIAVGDATAEAARAAGFTDVVSAQGTSADVTALILKTLSKDTPIIHCSGRHVHGSIMEDLEVAGYRVCRDIYYQSEAVRDLPDADFNAITHVIFYSPFAARTFRTLLMRRESVKASLDIHKLAFISISQATDAALGDLTPALRLIAKAPNEAAMLALFD